jgi:uncharacterized cupin superfamily protein
MPVIDPAAAVPETGSSYPPGMAEPVAAREVRSLSDLAGARDLVVNHVTLPPGSWSSQRPWHQGEDEVLVMLTGTATLVDDAGPRPIRAGEVAIFPAGDGNAHHLRNEGTQACTFVVASRPEASPVTYPDAGMRWTPEGGMAPL